MMQARSNSGSQPLLLVIEDDPGIQELIRYTLDLAGFRVICTDSAEGGQTIISKELPDCAIIDWMLPGMSGIQMTRQLRAEARTRQLPILMVTARGEEADRVAGLTTGADDYIVKPFSPKELVARIQAVLRRRAPELAQAVLAYGPFELNGESHEVRVAGTIVDLKPAEFKLLRFFLGHPERIFSRQQLLDQVWGDHVYVEERTVDAQIRRLRVAVGPAGESCIETVHGVGYRLAAGSSAGWREGAP